MCKKTLFIKKCTYELRTQPSHHKTPNLKIN